MIVNQAGTRASGERTYGTLARACTTFLRRTPALAGIIRRDERVRDTIRRQALLLTRHPATAAAGDTVMLATGLLSRNPEGNPAVRHALPGNAPGNGKPA